jgi:very-short-patch-repair endonuclease
LSNQSESPGCLSFIFKLFGLGATENASKSAAEFPYQRKDYLLTKGERAFFDVLQSAVGTDFLLFSKVRLADLIFVRTGTEKRQTYFNRIQSKHIDFVLCTLDVVRPILAIELDDSSHDREDRQQRDGFVDSALAAAGLPILHVKASARYDAKAVRKAIDAKLGGSAAP